MTDDPTMLVLGAVCCGIAMVAYLIGTARAKTRRWWVAGVIGACGWAACMGVALGRAVTL